jgi:Leucine-rich repeat (LRR) protein
VETSNKRLILTVCMLAYGMIVVIAAVLVSDCEGGHGASPEIIDPWVAHSLDDAIKRRDEVIQLEVRWDTATTLPDKIKLLYKLKYLWWKDGNLKILPDVVAELPELETIKLGRNRIETISRKLPKLSKLRYIYMEDNYIITLPEEICSVGNLNELVLENNRITLLPDSIGKLTSLRILDLRRNPVPQQEIERIRNVIPKECEFLHD